MWSLFAAFVFVALLVDFFAMSKQGAHRVSTREAATWSLVWVGVSFVFMGWLWWYLGGTGTDEAARSLANAKSLEFLTGYLIEKALAVDNIFVFLMLFTYFAVPAEHQRRVLVLGVIGAIVLRVVMILIGAWLIAKFHWVLYVFGLFLLVTGIKMLVFANQKPDLERNPALTFMRRHLDITPGFHGERFFVMQGGLRRVTPLFVVMVLIAITDLVFAVDSIPAIFAITEDPFIVMTSNVFAVLGLRALYFLLADLAERFHLLSYGLGVVLVFVGMKMLVVDFLKVPVFMSLGIVGAILAASILASLWVAPKKT
jgi:tellurite resistance protein TerC